MTAPDLVIVNADIVTFDPLFPRVRALAVRGGLVCALGSDDDMRALAGPRTRMVDCGGRMVLPGFQDAHIHLQDSGQNYAFNAPLDKCDGVAELQDALRRHAAKTTGAWVNGVGWYSGIFHEGNLDRRVLDAAVPDRPSLIVASDGHNACLNSAAIAALGIGSDTPDPDNGRFVRDAAGEPTGMLYETAIVWAEARMPAPGDDDFAEGVLYAQKLANRHGITGVLDASVGERHARVYQRLADAGELTVRVGATAKVFPEETTAAAVARLEALRRDHDRPTFKVHSAKFFLDGVIENRTAAMLAPYSDAAGGNAPLMFHPEQIREMFTAFDAARFQIHVHVIGDAACRAALDGLAAARAANGAWPSLHQIAHVQCIDPADIARFGLLGAMANIQPLWARHEPSVDAVALPLIGAERGRWMYAFRSLIDAGAPYCLSSDWGVSTLNPFQIIETAVTRQPPAREGGHPVFLPEQRLTREQAIAGYTVHAADACWRKQNTGSLSPGKSADLIVLDRDILACPARDIGDTEVLATFLSGRTVHAMDALGIVASTV